MACETAEAREAWLQERVLEMPWYYCDVASYIAKMGAEFVVSVARSIRRGSGGLVGSFVWDREILVGYIQLDSAAWYVNPEADAGSRKMVVPDVEKVLEGLGLMPNVNMDISERDVVRRVS